MNDITRLPALPLIVCDPYFSIWCPGDLLTDADTAHWAGAVKPLRGKATIDGASYRFMGLGDEPAMAVVSQTVSPTATEVKLEAGGARVSVRFWAAALADDLDALSTPIAYIDITVASADGEAHDVAVEFTASDRLCYDGDELPELSRAEFGEGGLRYARVGRAKQQPLCHSGDHITIDWGYLYLAAEDGVSAEDGALAARRSFAALTGDASYRLMLGYDDIASINYFGALKPAWHARRGETIIEAFERMLDRRDEYAAACEALDKRLDEAALASGGEDMAAIARAAYRHVIGAHKLIEGEDGKPVFLSKENDSNGCIGTVDVSYPSAPLFLLLNPELVRAMCRPALRFAAMPVWTYDFAPHDVGRYPYATGQVYGLACAKECRPCGRVYPPIYLMPASADCYSLKSQMPVEESGNMILLLAASAFADGDYSLCRAAMPLLSKWVKYLTEFGEDPGEQLCTDDFAGHLARNVNLAAKAVMGVAAYAQIVSALGNRDEGETYMASAREMAESWLKRSDQGGYTSLTFDGQGFSMKYNLAWDRVLGFDLLPDDFYRRETESYLPRMNKYGLPLDSRSDYTKSDWILWVAAMAEVETRRALIAPVARYLRESASRVAFSDWYYTSTGLYHSFIGRSVQGGLYMPLLADAWKERRERPARRGCDMLVKLNALAPDPALEDKLLAKGVKIVRVMPPNYGLVTDFVREHFSEGWANECGAGIWRNTCYAAVRGKEVIGFACFDATMKNFFGPTGVREDMRGLGIGKALLMRCMLSMREQGYAYAIIGWAGPKDFYKKAVGAIEIPDSTQYSYCNMIR